MPNRRRGEVAVTIAGERYTLCLTLGALAELEAAFGVADLAALGERFARGRLAGGDCIKLLGAALRGGGQALGDDEVADLPIDNLAGVVEALVELLGVTFGTHSPNPPAPQPA